MKRSIYLIKRILKLREYLKKKYLQVIKKLKLLMEVTMKYLIMCTDKIKESIIILLLFIIKNKLTIISLFLSFVTLKVATITNNIAKNQYTLDKEMTYPQISVQVNRNQQNYIDEINIYNNGGNVTWHDVDEIPYVVIEYFIEDKGYSISEEYVIDYKKNYIIDKYNNGDGLLEKIQGVSNNALTQDIISQNGDFSMLMGVFHNDKFEQINVLSIKTGVLVHIIYDGQLNEQKKIEKVYKILTGIEYSNSKKDIEEASVVETNKNDPLLNKSTNNVAIDYDKIYENYNSATDRLMELGSIGVNRYIDSQYPNETYFFNNN